MTAATLQERGNAQAPAIVAIATAICGVCCIWIRCTAVGASSQEAAASFVVLIASLAIVMTAGRRGYLSLGGVAGLLSVVAFWLKWLFGISPDGPQVQAYPGNAAALSVYAVFIATYGLTWIVTVRKFGASHHFARRDPTGPDMLVDRAVLRPRSVSTAGPVGLALFCLVLRVVLARVFGIGVPGQVPRLAVDGHLLGALYFGAVYIPLILALHLFRSGSRAGFRACIFILIAYSLIGAELGSRGAGASAAVVLVFAFAMRHNSATGERRGRSGKSTGVLLGAAFATAATTLALARRPSAGTSSSDPIQFMLHRVGGIEYLAPIVQYVRESAPSLEYISPTAWSSYVKVGVYGYPSDATTGFASTLVGWLYGMGALTGCVIGGLILGVLTGLADRSLRNRVRLGSDSAAIMYLGILLGWVNLFLEGTPKDAAYMVVVFAVAAVLTRRRLRPSQVDQNCVEPAVDRTAKRGRGMASDLV